MVSTWGRGPAYFEAAFKDASLPSSRKVWEGISESFLSRGVSLSEGPLEAFVEEKITLSANAFDRKGDFGIVAAPVRRHGFQSFGS
jgi:hypothetical protein